jgi:hypothetical protein
MGSSLLRVFSGEVGRPEKRGPIYSSIAGFGSTSDDFRYSWRVGRLARRRLAKENAVSVWRARERIPRAVSVTGE